MAAGIVSHKGDVIGAGSMEGLAGQRRAADGGFDMCWRSHQGALSVPKVLRHAAGTSSSAEWHCVPQLVAVALAPAQRKIQNGS